MAETESQNKYESDPRESTIAAYRIASLPVEYSGTRHKLLHQRGFNILSNRSPSSDQSSDIDDGTIDLGELIEDFAATAMRHDRGRTVTSEPEFYDPASLSLVAGLAGYAVTEHDELRGLPEKNLRPLTAIRDYYFERLHDLIAASDRQLTVLEELAEHIYAKPQPDHVSPPPTVCTGVGYVPEFRDTLYVEIPMVAASSKCLVYAVNGQLARIRNRRHETTDGELVTEVKDNNLYVPIADLLNKHRELMEDDFFALVSSAGDILSSDEEMWLFDAASGIHDSITRRLENAQEQLIYNDWDEDSRFAKLVVNALSRNPDHELGGAYTATTLYEALSEYDGDYKWEERRLGRLNSPRQVVDHLESAINEFPAWDKTYDAESGTTLYHVQGGSSQYKDLHVDELKDLFQLPCFQNLDDKLHEQSPVRKWLFSFVRLCSWLPQYYDAPDEKLVQDIQDIFSQYPWYDPQTTTYQTRYELTNTISGETPLPMNCDNDTMQMFCIGQDACDYNIYQSVNFHADMYDELDGRE